MDIEFKYRNKWTLLSIHESGMTYDAYGCRRFPAQYTLSIQERTSEKMLDCVSYTDPGSGGWNLPSGYQRCLDYAKKHYPEAFKK